ncbi:MAG: hypothetical protein IT384_25305 [Deltaproteobacteria bacterium]|nr:hypothetical protein [Deltaproteobacteria bacterium]
MNPRTIAAGLAVALLLAPAAALPCGNAIFLRTDEATQLVAKAEKAFEQRRYRRVLALVDSIEGHIRDGNLRRRVSTVYAAALVRAGSPTRGVQGLRDVLEADRENATVEAYLAEGLSKLEHGRAEALEILTRLAERDLIADPEGYRALARLKALAGDAEGKAAAIAACARLSGSATRCEKGLPKVAKTQTPPSQKVAEASVLDASS